MSKVENERCIEDDECADDLICLSGLCKDPKGSFAEVSKFQKEHLEKKRNKDDAELEISGIKAQKEKLQKQLADLEKSEKENQEKIKKNTLTKSQKKQEIDLLKKRAEEIDRMPQETKQLVLHTIDENTKSENMCAVCLNPLYSFERLIFCNRNHPIHASCFMGMYQTNIGRTEVRCPSGRTCGYSQEVMQYARENNPNVTIRRPSGDISNPLNAENRFDDVLDIYNNFSSDDNDAAATLNGFRPASLAHVREQLQRRENYGPENPFLRLTQGNVARHTSRFNNVLDRRDGSEYSNDDVPDIEVNSDDETHNVNFTTPNHNINTSYIHNPNMQFPNYTRRGTRIPTDPEAAAQTAARHEYQHNRNFRNLHFPPRNSFGNNSWGSRVDFVPDEPIRSRNNNGTSGNGTSGNGTSGNGTSGNGTPGGKKNTRKRKWSKKYKKTINCKKPKGFSQKQHCKYKRKTRRK
jgi:hypothetical protein